MTERRQRGRPRGFNDTSEQNTIQSLDRAVTVLQSLEAGDDTYQAVHSLWDDAVDFSEPDSEEEEDEEMGNEKLSAGDSIEFDLDENGQAKMF